MPQGNKRLIKLICYFTGNGTVNVCKYKNNYDSVLEKQNKFPVITSCCLSYSIHTYFFRWLIFPFLHDKQCCFMPFRYFDIKCHDISPCNVFFGAFYNHYNLCLLFHAAISTQKV